MGTGFLKAPSPIRWLKPQVKNRTLNAGKIYVCGNYVQVEQGESIRVIYNSKADMPVKEGFIQVKCCAEVEMRDGFIYTNSFNDLVTLKYDFANNMVHEIK